MNQTSHILGIVIVMISHVFAHVVSDIFCIFS